MRFALLMPAAGSGERLGLNSLKAMIELGGKPLFVRSAEVFLRHPDCAEAVIAIPHAEHDLFAKAVEEHLPGLPVRLIDGGDTRQDSVGCALRVVEAAVDVVLVHDAARPFADVTLIDRVLGGVDSRCIAAIPAIQISDSLKRAAHNGPFIHESIPRTNVHAAQTPQAVQIDVFRRAHELAERESFQGTDDVSLIERFHLGTTRIVAGTFLNFKITTQEDLQRARQMIC